MSLTVFFWVQHLLGIGHVRRAATIARALTAAGHRTLVAQGGAPVAGVDWGGATVRQLPPLASDPGFTRLFEPETGAAADAARWGARQASLTAILEEAPPDIVLLEGWPLARGKFTAEIEGLLHAAAARSGPVVATSLRDILVNKADATKAASMAGKAERFCDLLLVHGDPSVARLEDSFPAAARVADRIRYTGFVADRRAAIAPPDGAGRDEIVVSAGGGVVGAGVYAAALAAAGDPRFRDFGWRLLLGPDLPGDEAARFHGQATARPEGPVPPGRIAVEPARPDFPGLLSVARLSVSQAGYNTAMDLAVTGCPAVLIPFAAGGESEQTVRAALWTTAGRAVVVAEAGLTGPALAAAAAEALTSLPDRLPRSDLPLAGADETVRLLERAVADRRGPVPPPPGDDPPVTA